MTPGKHSLIRRWAHAPWHAWIKDEPQWLDIFAELWTRLPEAPLKTLLTSTRPLIILPPVHFGRVVRIKGPLLLGASILQLDDRLLERPREQTLGILAHELAHLCVPASDNELTNDLLADRLVRSWGLGPELLQALNMDLDAQHPRVTEARTSLAA
jgi:hypothetical protein